MNPKDLHLTEEGLKLAAAHRQRALNEKEWIHALMYKDRRFLVLAHTRHHHAHAGKIFVAWELQGGAPAIRALLRVREFNLSASTGIRIEFDISMPSGSSEIEICHRPRFPAGLPNLYLWVPGNAEARFIPLNREALNRSRILHVPFLARCAGQPDHEKRDGYLYFESVPEFSKRWPDHAF